MSQVYMMHASSLPAGYAIAEREWGYVVYADEPDDRGRGRHSTRIGVWTNFAAAAKAAHLRPPLINTAGGRRSRRDGMKKVAMGATACYLGASIVGAISMPAIFAATGRLCFSASAIDTGGRLFFGDRAMEHQTNEEWAGLMAAVAIALKGEPDEKRGHEWRWLGQAGFLVDIEKGVWNHFGGDKGGGCLALVEYELNTDRKGALAWLRAQGFIATPEAGGRRAQQPTPRRDPQREKQHAEQRAERERQQHQDRERKKNYAVRLWSRANPIAGANHPARQWASKLNLLHPWVPFPSAIRWLGAKDGKGGAVVAAFTPVASWLDGWPDVIDVCGVSLVAIDQHGEKRMAFGEGTRDKTSYGPLSSGVVAMGPPSSERVVLVEGLKDMLAVYSHFPEPCAVLATITTLRGCLSRPGLVDYLDGRDVVLLADTDAAKTDKRGITRHAGQDAGRKVQEELANRGIAATLHLSDSEGTDPGDWALSQKWPDIDRGDFDAAATDLRATWPEGEAARRAIHGRSIPPAHHSSPDALARGLVEPEAEAFYETSGKHLSDGLAQDEADRLAQKELNGRGRVAAVVPPAFHELTAEEIEEHVAGLGTFQGIDLSAPWPQRTPLGAPMTLDESIEAGLRHETRRKK